MKSHRLLNLTALLLLVAADKLVFGIISENVNGREKLAAEENEHVSFAKCDPGYTGFDCLNRKCFEQSQQLMSLKLI